MALNFYRIAADSSKKGAMFDDCLYRAREYCKSNGKIKLKDKPLKKSKAPTAGTVRSLF